MQEEGVDVVCQDCFPEELKMFIPCSVPGAEGGRDSPLNTLSPLCQEREHGAALPIKDKMVITP